MATIEILRPYVEQRVAEFLGVEKLRVDVDGTIPIRAGSSVCFARLVDGPTGPMFRVFAHLLSEISSSPPLLERLNELNAEAPFVRFFWVDDSVFCAMDLEAETLQPDEINNALSAVMWHADHHDDLLQKDFGGSRLIEEDTSDPRKDGGGGYL